MNIWLVLLKDLINVTKGSIQEEILFTALIKGPLLTCIAKNISSV